MFTHSWISETVNSRTPVDGRVPSGDVPPAKVRCTYRYRMCRNYYCYNPQSVVLRTIIVKAKPNPNGTTSDENIGAAIISEIYVRSLFMLDDFICVDNPDAEHVIGEIYKF